MSRLLTFDPGTRHVGWAAFDDGELRRCGLVPTEPALLERMFGAGLAGVQAVIELPQVYQRRKLKGDPNDLIHVAVAAGMLRQACAGAAVSFVLPHDWKGSAPKKIVTQRIRERLSPGEKLVVGACGAKSSLAHNVLDAVGLGLWHLGRFGGSERITA